MTRSFRSRLTLAATCIALLAAGAVVAAQAFAGSAPSASVNSAASETAPADGAAVTMHNWTETGPRHGSIINP
jgi:hypothetical protein